MDAPIDVIAVVGSLRRDSYNRKLAEAVRAIAPPALAIEILTLEALPFYNQDDEAAPPDATQQFRARVKRADAVLFFTPEYNRSVPGLLKNAVDTGSRPYGHNVWAGKPAAIVSASPGALGGFGANHHLRQSLVALDMPTMAQPEAYISHVDKVVDSSGRFVSQPSSEFFRAFLAAFEAWTAQHRRPQP